MLAGLLALGLAGCSTVKLAYNNLPELSYWWLDGYLDFDDSQAPRVRAELERLLAWHRRNELPRWIELLQQAQQLAPGDATAAQACALNDAVRDRLLVLAEQAEPASAELALTLAPAQLQHLQRKLESRNAEFADDWLDATPEAIQTRRYKRWLDWAETLYGTLDETQRAALRAMVAKPPFDPPMAEAQHRPRQAVLLAGLASLQDGASAAKARQVLKDYVQMVAQPAPGGWREHREALQLEGCRNFAALHASTNAQQRAHARQRLLGYEQDLRALRSP